MGGTAAAAVMEALASGLAAVAFAIVAASFGRSRTRTKIQPLAFLLLPLAVAASAHGAVLGVSTGLLGYVGKRWGESAAARVLDWSERAAASVDADAGDMPRLAAANAYWNRVRYADDPRHWLARDYWATPVKMLGSGAGDCEDYAFGK